METMKQVVKRLVRESVLSESEVAEALGTSRQNLNNKLRSSARSDMKAGEAVRVLDVLGYRVVVAPKGRRLPEGCVEVTADEV